ncbi:type II/IV secretion system protein, partial [Clostridium perfringens]|nr:type II/IV secretion system protein [Clostridium perfringens]
MNILEFDISKVDISISRKLNKNKALENKSLPIMVKEDSIITLASRDELNNKDEIEFLFSKKLQVHKVSEEFIQDLIEKIFLGEKENLFEVILN